MHGRRGQGMQNLVGFCARQRSSWAGALEKKSLQATFRWSWQSRLTVSVARAAFSHLQLALTKLLPERLAPGSKNYGKAMTLCSTQRSFLYGLYGLLHPSLGGVEEIPRFRSFSCLGASLGTLETPSPCGCTARVGMALNLAFALERFLD